LRKRVAGISEATLSRFALRARRAAGLIGELNILITGDEEMRELNRRFRSKDKATDVLSFPSALPDAAGDIAISGDIARRNGEELGHGVLTELKVLILHGVLHLAGYDHESDRGKMARKESKLREQLGLHEGLIERSANRVLAPKKAPKKRSTSMKIAKQSAKTNAAGKGRQR